jgi:hypothetical protein
MVYEIIVSHSFFDCPVTVPFIGSSKSPFEVAPGTVICTALAICLKHGYFCSPEKTCSGHHFHGCAFYRERIGNITATFRGKSLPPWISWDGGALAMKTYGHLRQEHSQAQAMRGIFRS